MKYINKQFAVIFSILLVILSFNSCSKINKINYIGNKDIINHFSDCMSPDEILEDVSKIDLNFNMNTDGLSSSTEITGDDTSIVTYTDKAGNTVYREYAGYSEKTFDYFTESLSGVPITVKYSFGYYENDNIRDVNIKSDKYSVIFERTNFEMSYGCEYVSITSLGKKIDKMQESISYHLSNGNWYISANYLDNEGMHSYSSNDDGEGNTEEYDFLLFRNQTVESMNLDEMDIFTAKSGSRREMKMKTEPFYSDTDGEIKWYFDGDILYIFTTSEEANKFASKFGSESEIRGDDFNGYYYTVTIENSGIPISNEYSNFDPYDYIDINDFYSVAFKLNDNGEITEISNGTIQFY